MQLMTSLLGIAATANGKGYSMNKCGLDIGNSSRQAGLVPATRAKRLGASPAILSFLTPELLRGFNCSVWRGS